MRYPRLRFTVRRLMVAVAVVGTTFWVALLGWRSVQSFRLSWHFREQAASWAITEYWMNRRSDWQKERDELERGIAETDLQASASEEPVRTTYRELSSSLRILLAAYRQPLFNASAWRRYYEALAVKHQRAALHPWLRIEADPPGPQ
jgi:hypothetical protein